MSSKKVIFLITFLFLSVHFLMTFIYCLPGELVGGRASFHATRYSVPLFHQGWNLFAPDPQGKNKSLDFRVRKNGEWGSWVRPANLYYEGHTSYRIGPDYKRYQVAQKVASKLWREIGYRDLKPTGQEIDLGSTFGYAQAEYYMSSFIVMQRMQEGVDSLQLRFVLQDALDETDVQEYLFDAAEFTDHILSEE